MKPAKEESLKDYKIAIIQSKKRYLIEVIEFRRRILEEKATDKLRDKKKKKL
ncbi:MAG: hypothetical protein KAW52_06980 [candidate division Zixibacteria bacterium]|nr:hypothetical protein [candidate division Zixibacteria bacterium]